MHFALKTQSWAGHGRLILPFGSFFRESESCVFLMSDLSVNKYIKIDFWGVLVPIAGFTSSQGGGRGEGREGTGGS